MENNKELSFPPKALQGSKIIRLGLGTNIKGTIQRSPIYLWPSEKTLSSIEDQTMEKSGFFTTLTIS